jgi:hypothetical protein
MDADGSRWGIEFGIASADIGDVGGLGSVAIALRE